MRMRWVLPAMLGLCGGGVRADDAAIPVHALFGNPAFSSLAISTDGRMLAAIHSRGDQQLIVVRPLAGGELKPVAKAPDPDTRLKWIAWANPGRLLVSAHARNPDAVGVRARVTRLFGVDADGGKFEWLGKRWPRFGQAQLQPFEQDHVVHWTPDDPAGVLVQVDPPYRDEWPRVMRMDVVTGALRPVVGARQPVVQWHADPRGRVRAGEAYADGGWYELWSRADGEQPFTRTWRRRALDAGPEFLDFHPEQASLAYVRDQHEGYDAIYEYDLAQARRGGRVLSVAAHDVDGLLRSSAGDGRVLGARFTTDVREVRYFDPKRQAMHEALARALAASVGAAVQVDPAGASTDGRWQLLRASADTHPPSWWLFDHAEGKLAAVAEERPGLPATGLAATRRVDFRARDGRRIPAYLTLPAGAPPVSRPMVLLAHGGPWARDAIEWNPEVQLFASRGWVVLQPQFRGSTGFGAEHREAGYREWGAAIQDDIVDAVRWAIAQGHADPERIAIYGASFGGYAALVGAFRTPELFRAAVAYAPVTDIEQLLDDDQWYAWGYDWHGTLIGDDRERLRANSPLHHADRFGGPVLIGHGEDDPRVHVRQSRRMVDALREAGKPVEYLEFADEVHGFALEANRIRWYESVVSFLERAIGSAAASDKVAAAAR